MIRGKKCILRAVEENDLALLARWINDPELAGLVVGWSFPLSLAKQQEWFKNSLKETRTQRFIIESLDGEVIGLTGLWEIDWVNRNALTAVKLGEPKARGKGYGTDAVLTLMAYAFFEVNLLLASFIIGSVTFIAAMVGMLFGKKVGCKLGRKMEIVGGIILFLIGLKILIEHLIT